MAKYKRILLKLSGESLMGENNTASTKKDWRNMPHKSKKSMNREYKSASLSAAEISSVD